MAAAVSPPAVAAAVVRPSRVLFVDDDPNVLDGLRRMLRWMRNEWEIMFASGADAALELMERAAFDLVVSDMRMPGRSGLDLLMEVKRRYPGTIRLILSGHADEELTLKLVGVAHQYLAKPCDAETLRTIIQRLFRQDPLRSNERVRQVLSETGTLPSLPSLYLEIDRELRSPDASTASIGTIVSQDPAMTAKVLQIANSSFFGLQRRVSSPAEATAYLGVERIRDLVLGLSIFSQFLPAEAVRRPAEQLWTHSVETGLRAREIAREEQAPQELGDAAFTAGILHDLGKLILMVRLPESWEEVERRTGGRAHDGWRTEQEVLGCTHEEIGGALLGLWGLPETIVEAVRYHHRPGSASPAAGLTPLLAVHVADALDFEPDGLDREYLRASGLLARVEAWSALRGRKED